MTNLTNVSNTSVDDLLGLNPSDLSVFHEKPQTGYDANVYKTNPKDSKSESGNYLSKVKIIYNPFNVKSSIVHQATYYMQDSEGGMLVRSKLGDGDRSCKIFSAWKQLWFSGDETKKAWAKEMFNKTESNWVLVQIIEDMNKPELVGKFMVMKIAQDIYDKLSAKMNPATETGKQPVSVMDYLIGPVLEMNVQPGPDDPKHPERKQREISYSLCDFEDEYTPIINVDGSPLFTDEELELIDGYYTANKDSVGAKTESKRQAAIQTKASLINDIKVLYKKALDYVKENAVNLEDECKFHEWDEKTMKRVQNWIDIVLSMRDPKTVSSNVMDVENTGSETLAPEIPNDDPFAAAINESPSSTDDDDLPF